MKIRSEEDNDDGRENFKNQSNAKNKREGVGAAQTLSQTMVSATSHGFGESPNTRNSIGRLGSDWM